MGLLNCFKSFSSTPKSKHQLNRQPYLEPKLSMTTKPDIIAKLNINPAEERDGKSEKPRNLSTSSCLPTCPCQTDYTTIRKETKFPRCRTSSIYEIGGEHDNEELALRKSAGDLDRQMRMDISNGARGDKERKERIQLKRGRSKGDVEWDLSIKLEGRAGWLMSLQNDHGDGVGNVTRRQIVDKIGQEDLEGDTLVECTRSSRANSEQSIRRKGNTE